MKRKQHIEVNQREMQMPVNGVKRKARENAYEEWAWINSAGRISSRISDFLGEHSSGRIRHFCAKFEQIDEKSVVLMICIT